jgi:1-hydroxycarotenoid 3,4-desaturase
VVRASAQPRVAHQVLFPERDYAQEFVDLFDHDRVPVDPTVYACDQALAHGRTGWSDGSVPLFVMVNAPAGGEADWGALAELVLAKLGAAGWAAPGDPIVWSRTPAGLAERFPGSRGALYGAASNGPGAAFRRPANRTSVPGLFLAGGTAHPGGGMPLCVSSGRAAAHEILEERR